MADFSLDGRIKVKTLKANFKKAFGASLRVYTTPTCKTPADDEKTLAALRAEGYKGGECVATVVRTAVTELHIDVKADSYVLKEEDTYDATRIEIVAKDQNGNRVPFADSAVKVTVKGAAEIIGPSEFPLIGGDRAFWIRTNGKKGDITVTIDAKSIGKVKLDLKSE